MGVGSKGREAGHKNSSLKMSSFHNLKKNVIPSNQFVSTLPPEIIISLNHH